EPELLRMRGERMVLVQEAPGRLRTVFAAGVARGRGELVRPGRAPGLPVVHPALDRIRTVEPHDLAGVGAQLDALALADEELLAVYARAQHDRAGALHTVQSLADVRVRPLEGPVAAFRRTGLHDERSRRHRSSLAAEVGRARVDARRELLFAPGDLIPRGHPHDDRG